MGLKHHFFTKKTGITMNNYELMVIFTPVLSEEEYKAAQKKFTAFVTENGGKVTHENPWGLKSLAYPIQKKNYRFILGSGVQCAIRLQ